MSDTQPQPDPATPATRALDDWLAGKPPADATARRLDHLLALLEPPGGVTASDELVDLTMLRVARLGSSPAAAPADQPADPPALTPLDAEALDAWLLASGRVERVAAPIRDRARRHQDLADAVTRGPTPTAASDLTDRVLARVAMADAPERPEPAVAGRIRMADLMSVAAVLIIGLSVVWPMLTAARDAHHRSIASTRLAATGSAMAAYASAYDSLPMATASVAGRPWWDVGESPDRSNSANLFTLAANGFVAMADLASPTNPSAPTSTAADARDWASPDQVSYSYQNMFGQRRHTQDATTPLVADRSPIVPRSRRGEAAPATANSLNFAGRGQHVLFGDGSVRWLTSPVLENGDNIWLPGRVERDLAREGFARLTGRETADGVEDAFLVP